VLAALAQGQLNDKSPVDSGTVTSLGSDTVTVKNELFTRVFRITAQTEILRVDSSPLQLGDDVGIRCLQAGGQTAPHCRVDDKGISIADQIEANVGKWEGVITQVAKEEARVRFLAPIKGSGKVTFDRRSRFDLCGIDERTRACTIDDVKVGRRLEVVGFLVGKNELRATSVLSIQTHRPVR